MTEKSLAEFVDACLEEFDPAIVQYKPQNKGPALAYVGHAPVRARFLRLDPEWSWEPLAYGEDGLPRVRQVTETAAEMWIKLTVNGITRLGVGTAESHKVRYGDDGKRVMVPNQELSKELISDALRNAALSFGVALYLWAKGALEGEDGEGGSIGATANEPRPAAAKQAQPAKKAAAAPRRAATPPPAKKAATPAPPAKKAATPPPRPAPAPAATEGELPDPNLLFKAIPKDRRQEAMAALSASPITADEGTIALWPFPSEKTRGEGGELISAETLEFALGEAVDALRAWGANAGVEL